MGEIFHASFVVSDDVKSVDTLQKLQQKLRDSTTVKIVPPERSILGQKHHHLYLFSVNGSQKDIKSCHKTLDGLSDYLQ